MADTHPLGFIKLTLLEVAGRRVRLHVWPRNAEPAQDCHNHRWSFVSLPLWGSFIDTRYAVADTTSHLRLTCRPDRGAGRLVEVDGVGGLVEAARFTRRPLLPYRCRRGEIHSYVPASKRFHASLVVTGRPHSDRSEVWRAS